MIAVGARVHALTCAAALSGRAVVVASAAVRGVALQVEILVRLAVTIVVLTVAAIRGGRRTHADERSVSALTLLGSAAANTGGRADRACIARANHVVDDTIAVIVGIWIATAFDLRHHRSLARPEPAHGTSLLAGSTRTSIEGRGCCGVTVLLLAAGAGRAVLVNRAIAIVV